MKSLFLFFSFIPFTSTAQDKMDSSNNVLKGTAIIISVLKDKIIIGSDSKQTLSGDNIENNKTIYGPKCKISHIGNFFFTAEGYTKMITPEIDFIKIIEKINLSRIKTFHDKVMYIDSLLRNPVYSFIANLEKYQPRAFKETLKKDEFLTICFAAFENGKPVTEALFWNVKSQGNHWKINSSISSSNLVPRYLFLGQRAAIDSFLKFNPNYLNNLDEHKINSLIKIQSKSTPKVVSLPIDIVILTPKGYKWISKREQCN